MSIEQKSNECSNRETVEKLKKIIDSEERKPLTQRDVDLITECVDYLMELEQGIELSNEELEEEKQKIYEYNRDLRKLSKNCRLKRMLIAACFVILTVSASFVATAQDFNAVSILKELEQKIADMIDGEKLEHNGYTISKVSDAVYYDSIEEFRNNTNIEVMYPAIFPQKLQLKNVMTSCDGDDSDYQTVMFITDNPDYCVIVHTNPDYRKDFINNKNLTLEIISGHKCYIGQINKKYQGSFVYRGSTYIVNAKTEDELKIIITNMKESF